MVPDVTGTHGVVEVFSLNKSGVTSISWHSCGSTWVQATATISELAAAFIDAVKCLANPRIVCAVCFLLHVVVLLTILVSLITADSSSPAVTSGLSHYTSK